MPYLPPAPQETDILKKLVATKARRRQLLEIIARVEGLPEGSVCTDAFTDVWTKDVVFIWAHPSFAIVPEGETIPLHQPV